MATVAPRVALNAVGVLVRSGAKHTEAASNPPAEDLVLDAVGRLEMLVQLTAELEDLPAGLEIRVGPLTAC